MSHDPEHDRRLELITRVRGGAGSDDEAEELALYVGDEERDRLARDGERARKLGGEWLARSEADARVAAIEEAPKRVRTLGLGLLGVGVLSSFVLPVVGATLTLSGLAILVGNLIRTRLTTLRHDPYRNVKR